MSYESIPETDPPTRENAEDIRRAFDAAYAPRIFTPETYGKTFDELVGTRETWRAQGATVVFTAGGYDLMHPNHTASFLAARLNGVRYRYENSRVNDSPWESLSAEARREMVTASFERDEVKLVVSIKGDSELASKKSFQPEKGNTPRPLQDWRTRAYAVLAVATPGYYGVLRPMVDAVTVDDEVSPEFEATPHHNLVAMVHKLRPDVWQIYAESKNLLHFAASGGLDEAIQVYQTAATYYEDSVSDEPLSTTLFIKKALGLVPLMPTMGANDSHSTQETPEDIQT